MGVFNTNNLAINSNSIKNIVVFLKCFYISMFMLGVSSLLYTIVIQYVQYKMTE